MGSASRESSSAVNSQSYKNLTGRMLEIKTSAGSYTHLDCDIEPSYSDLDASDSGRDEAGFMHREVVREKVATWPIAYSCLTDDEYK